MSDNELTTRDKLAAFIAVSFSLGNPFEVASVLAPFVDELLLESFQEGFKTAEGLWK
jgi:hypothetical protein